MKKKYSKITFLALAVLAISLIACFLYKGLLSGKALTLENHNVSENNDFFRIRAEYPQFPGASRDFNNKIKDLIAGKISEFKNNSNEYWKARRETALPGETVPTAPEVPFEFIAQWKHDRLDDRYISVVLNIYYFSGGAHGNEEIYTFNYDLKNRREIGIMDFVGSEENLQEISNLAKAQLSASLESMGWRSTSDTWSMLDEGAAPTAENYKDFTFNRDVLTVYFQKYQVAAGAAGSQQTSFYKDNLDATGIDLNWPN
ncbi:MAG TPA: DUF3298 and DUF4163 domain-containing protein [Candidatus Colwellbacteria bacterium]|mgnify:CR=1 FL=1|nr:DUF3298 and DUF4163 domain-containing protein [Candidatus Colwellbacteria bacterium]HQA96213.1 DUF3298 and DUF4163 domain-containing protein [Candidatus Colwellbacteria bacterium]